MRCAGEEREDEARQHANDAQARVDQLVRQKDVCLRKIAEVRRDIAEEIEPRISQQFTLREKLRAFVAEHDDQRAELEKRAARARQENEEVRAAVSREYRALADNNARLQAAQTRANEARHKAAAADKRCDKACAAAESAARKVNDCEADAQDWMRVAEDAVRTSEDARRSVETTVKNAEKARATAERLAHDVAVQRAEHECESDRAVRAIRVHREEKDRLSAHASQLAEEVNTWRAEWQRLQRRSDHERREALDERERGVRAFQEARIYRREGERYLLRGRTITEETRSAELACVASAFGARARYESIHAYALRELQRMQTVEWALACMRASPDTLSSPEDICALVYGVAANIAVRILHADRADDPYPLQHSVG